MTVHRIFVSSEQRLSGSRGDFVVDTSAEFAKFQSRRVMCAVEFCDVVRYSSTDSTYAKDPENPGGLLLECPDLVASNSYESWSQGSSCALALLQSYATAGVYGIAHDMPYCRTSHIGIPVDYDFVKRLGTMRFRLRRCPGALSSNDFQLAQPSDYIEAWSFQLVFWEPCGCLLKSPWAYDHFRVWLSSAQGSGSVVDCRVPVLLNSSRSVDTSEGKWMVALEFMTPLLNDALVTADHPPSLVLACPTLVDSTDQHVLAHLGKSHRPGETGLYGQRFSIMPGSRDTLGHELRTPIDSLTSLHLQLRHAATLELLDNPGDYDPPYTLSLIFYRVK